MSGSEPLSLRATAAVAPPAIATAPPTLTHLRLSTCLTFDDTDADASSACFVLRFRRLRRFMGAPQARDWRTASSPTRPRRGQTNVPGDPTGSLAPPTPAVGTLGPERRSPGTGSHEQ